MGLIEKYKGVSVQKLNKSVEVRRKLAEDSNNISELSSIDKEIFIASTKRTIAEIPEEELYAKIANVTEIIIKDLGIKSIDAYTATRFSEILKNYYSNLSLYDIKLAFELSATGHLNDYLPKDKNGFADNNHYQSFSVSYIGKILNAYLKRRADMEYDLYNNAPKKTEISQENKNYFLGFSEDKFIMEFLRYKYTGIVIWNDVNDFIFYEKIKDLGYETEINVTDVEREEAVKRLLKKAQSGVINTFVTECIRAMQTRHSYVNDEAMFIARRKSILASFDKMIKDEIQIIDLLIKN